MCGSSGVRLMLQYAHIGITDHCMIGLKSSTILCHLLNYVVDILPESQFVTRLAYLYHPCLTTSLHHRHSCINPGQYIIGVLASTQFPQMFSQCTGALIGTDMIEVLCDQA